MQPKGNTRHIPLRLAPGGLNLFLEASPRMMFALVSNITIDLVDIGFTNRKCFQSAVPCRAPKSAQIWKSVHVGFIGIESPFELRLLTRWTDSAVGLNTG